MHAESGYEDNGEELVKMKMRKFKDLINNLDQGVEVHDDDNK